MDKYSKILWTQKLVPVSGHFRIITLDVVDLVELKQIPKTQE